jgi:cysteine desulfurase/selenocysteine lyase
MIREVSLEKATFNDLPWKFEAGTPNVGGVVGLGAAVDYLSGLGMSKVRQHSQDLASYALEKLGGIDGLRIYGPRDNALRGSLVSFTARGIHPHDLATALDEEGIAIRSGHHCAMPLHRHLKLPATARASFYLYNQESDLDLLCEGIKKAQKILG